MNRTIHNNVCMYINRVLSMIKDSVLGGGLVVREELYNNGYIDSSVVFFLSPPPPLPFY